MLLLAASLLLYPHYEMTRASETPIAFTTDVKGNAYVVESGAGDAEYVSRFDPDGRLAYHVAAPFSGPSQTAFIAIAADNAGNLYAALSSAAVARIDPSGNMVTFPIPISQGVTAIAAGPDGSFYLTGTADAHYLPTTPGAWISAAQAAAGVTAIGPLPFAMRIGPSGQLIYSTFLDSYHTPSNPPAVNIVGSAIAVDAAGNAYIAGTNTDPDFPTTAGAYQGQCCTEGNETAFVLKLNPAGTAPVYSTFLPGQTAASVAVDAAGNASLAINAFTVNTNNQFTSFNITTAKLNPRGNQLSEVINTPLPVNSELFYAAADGQGNLLITGQPVPASLALSEGAFNNGNTYVEILRLADGVVLYASLLPTGAGGIAISPDGAGGFILLGGGTNSFPVGLEPGERPTTMLTRFEPAAAPQPTILGIANVAESAVSEGLAPGELIGIYGTNLGPSAGILAGLEGGALPSILGGTQVLFNGTSAPLLWAGADQVNAVVPFEIASAQTISIQVRASGATSNTVQLQELPTEPAVITHMGSAAALNQDGSINSQANPAQLGSVVSVFLNGAGLENPTPADGTLASVGPRPALPVSVQASAAAGYFATWEDCALVYAGAAPDEISGLLQVNFQLPAQVTNITGQAANGQVAILVTVGTQLALSNIWIAQ